MLIDHDRAREILREEAASAGDGADDSWWAAEIERLWVLCAKAYRTHLAFIATAILAKATNSRADVFALKVGAGTHGAYSARALCKGVLAAEAPRLGINIGVTGPEPLNNQPYFREQRVDRNLPVRSSARPALEQVLILLERLAPLTEAEARQALRAYINVGRLHAADYPLVTAEGDLGLDALLSSLESVVAARSEGGKRAQAAVAAVLDAAFGRERVILGKVNDPDRHLPGDVGLCPFQDHAGWERIMEVRDKPVALHDAYAFSTKVLAAGVPHAALIAMARRQSAIDFTPAVQWARERGLDLVAYASFGDFAREALHWGPSSMVEAARQLPELYRDRLVEVEASRDAVTLWIQLLGARVSPPVADATPNE